MPGVLQTAHGAHGAHGAPWCREQGSPRSPAPIPGSSIPPGQEQRVWRREPRADTAYQAQTAVAHSNYQALDVFHWFISIWQDLKFQGHKTQSCYFISGKCTATSLESCPFVIKGQVQRREWRRGISSHHIPPSRAGTSPSTTDCSFCVALLKAPSSASTNSPWQHQQSPVIPYSTDSCVALHTHTQSTHQLKFSTLHSSLQ